MRLALILTLALALPSTVCAQRAEGELRAGGGYDSNPALATDPGNRGRPEDRATTMGGGVFRIDGDLAGTIGDPIAGIARFDLDGRVFGSGDFAFAERLTIGGVIPVDDVRFRCAVYGGRLDVTLTPDDAWSAGARCGVIASLPERFWISGDLEAGVRAFDAADAQGFYGASLGAGWRHELVQVELGLDVMRRASDDREAERVDVVPWISIGVTTQYVGGAIGYTLIAREFDHEVRSGQEHIGRAEVWGMPLPWIGAYAELELGYAQGRSQALEYERVQVIGGLRLVLDWHEEASDSEAQEDEDGVHFSFELPGAERASIVGDWNGWDETEGVLTRHGDRFEGTFAIEPGHHAYHLIVDGEPMRPPNATRYVHDDFGGENAVIVVSESRSP